MKQVALSAFILIALACSINAVADPYVKFGVTSVHFGDTDGYDFNNTNIGLGIGYDHTQYELAGTLVRPSTNALIYQDSYGCRAGNLQGRLLTPVTGRLHVGGAINLAHKCFDEQKQLETRFVPTFVSVFYLASNVRAVLDGAPPFGENNPFGFIGLSIETRF